MFGDDRSIVPPVTLTRASTVRSPVRFHTGASWTDTCSSTPLNVTDVSASDGSSPGEPSVGAFTYVPTRPFPDESAAVAPPTHRAASTSGASASTASR